MNSTFIVAAVVIKRNHTGTVGGISFGGAAFGSTWVLVTDVNVTVASFGSAAQAVCVSFVGVIARVFVANAVITAASGSIASGVIAFNASRPTSSITVVNVTGAISAQANARFIEISNCWACRITVASVTVDQGHSAYATLGLDSMWQPAATFQTLHPVAPLGTAFSAMVGIFSSRGAIDVTVTEARCVLSANVTAQVLIAEYSDSGAEAVPLWVVDSPLYRSPVTGARRSTVMNVTVSSSSARVVPWQFDPTSEVDAGRLADAVDNNSGPTTALPYPFGLSMVTFLAFQVSTKDVTVPVKEEVHMTLHRCEAIVQGTADVSGAISAMFISGIDADNATVAVTDTTFVAAMDAAGHVALARICERGFSGEAIDVRGNRLVAGLPFLGDRETLAALFSGALGPSALPPSEYNVSRAKTSVAKSQGIVTKLNRVSGTFHVHSNVVTTTATVLQCIVASATAARANVVLIASNLCRHVGVEAFKASSEVVIVSHISHVETVAFVGNTVDILHTETTTILPLSLRYINGSLGTVLFGNNTVRVRHIRSLLTTAQVTRIQRSQSVWSLYVDLVAAGRATICRMAVVGNVLDATPVFLTAASVLAGFSYGVSFYLDRRDFDCAWWDPTFPPALMDVLSESYESVVTALSTNSVLLQNNTVQAKTWALRLGIPPGPLIAVRDNTVYHVQFGLFVTNTAAWREGSLLSVTGNAFISRGSAARGLIVHQVRTPYDYTLTSALANPSGTELGNLPRLYEIRHNTFSLLYLPSAALSAADKTRCRTQWAQGNVAVEVRPTAALHGTISNSTIDVSDNRVVLAYPFVGVAFCAASFFVVTATFARALIVSRNIAVGIPQGAFLRVETMGIVAPGGTAPSLSSTAIPTVVVTRNVILSPSAALDNRYVTQPWRPLQVIYTDLKATDRQRVVDERVVLECNTLNGMAAGAGAVECPNVVDALEIRRCTASVSESRTVSRRTGSATVNRSATAALSVSASSTRSHQATLTERFTATATVPMTNTATDAVTETLSRPVIVTPPPSVALSTAEGVVLSSAGVVGGALGTMGAGSLGTVARLSATAAALQCEDAALDDKPQPWSSNPLRVSIPAARHAQHYVGTVVGNAAIVVGVSFVVLCTGVPIAWVRAWRGSRESTSSDVPFPPPWRDQLAAAALPSLLVLPVALLLQPTVACAVACIAGFGDVLEVLEPLRDGRDSAASDGSASGEAGVVWRSVTRSPPTWVLFLGAVAVVVCAAGYGAVSFRLMHRLRLVFLPTHRAADLAPKGGGTKPVRALIAVASWCEPFGEWHGEDAVYAPGGPTARSVSRGERDLQRFRLFVDGLAGHCPWYLLLELGLSALSGALEGLQPHLGCALAAWAQLIVLTAALVAIVIVRPYASRIDTVFALSCAVLVVIAAVLAVYVQLRWGGTDDGESEPGGRRAVRAVFSGITVTASVLSTARAVWDALLFLLYWWARHRRVLPGMESAGSTVARLGRITTVLVFFKAVDPPLPSEPTVFLPTLKEQDVEASPGFDDYGEAQDHEMALLPAPGSRVGLSGRHNGADATLQRRSATSDRWPLAPVAADEVSALHTVHPHHAVDAGDGVAEQLLVRPRPAISYAELQRLLQQLRGELRQREAAVVSARALVRADAVPPGSAAWGEAVARLEAAEAEWQETVAAIEGLCDEPL